MIILAASARWRWPRGGVGPSPRDTTRDSATRTIHVAAAASPRPTPFAASACWWPLAAVSGRRRDDDSRTNRFRNTDSPRGSRGVAATAEDMSWPLKEGEDRAGEKLRDERIAHDVRRRQVHDLHEAAGDDVRVRAGERLREARYQRRVGRRTERLELEAADVPREGAQLHGVLLGVGARSCFGVGACGAACAAFCPQRPSLGLLCAALIL